MMPFILTCFPMHGISMGGLYANFVTSQTSPNPDNQLFVPTILWERITLAILPYSRALHLQERMEGGY